METSISERIRLIRDVVYHGNVTRMAQGTYIKRTTLNGLISDEDSQPSYDVIRRIAEMSSPKINLSWLIRGEGDMFETEKKEEQLCPRVPVAVMAGLTGGAEDQVMLRDCEMRPVVRAFRGYDITMPVFGDSMYPNFMSGDEVALRKVEDNKHIEWGEVYVVAAHDGAVLKRIFPGDHGNIKCVSFNPDYAPFDIDKSEIRALYRVVGLIRQI